jgi:hypothetical protein
MAQLKAHWSVRQPASQRQTSAVYIEKWKQMPNAGVLLKQEIPEA